MAATHYTQASVHHVAEPDDTEPRTACQVARHIGAALLLPSCGAFIAVTLYTTLAPIVLKADGESDSVAGVVVGIIGIGRVLVALPTGSISLVLGPRLTYLGAVLVCVVGLGVAATAPSKPYVLYAASLVMGMGSGAIAVPRTELLQHLTKDTSIRATASSQLGGVYRVSFMVAPALGGLLLQHIDAPGQWPARVAFLSGLPFLVFAAAFVLGSRLVQEANMESQATSDAAFGEQPTLLGRTTTMANAVRENVGLVVRMGVYCASVFALRSCRLLLTTLVALLMGWTSGEIGVLLTLSYSVDAAFFWVGASITRRKGYRPSAMALPAISAMAYALLAVPIASDVHHFGFWARSWPIVCGAVLFGIADCFGSGLVMALVASCPRPTVSALLMLQDLGAFIAPVMAGVLSHNVSTRVACATVAGLSLAMVGWAGLVLPAPATGGSAVDSPRQNRSASGPPRNDHHHGDRHLQADSSPLSTNAAEIETTVGSSSMLGMQTTTGGTTATGAAATAGTDSVHTAAHEVQAHRRPGEMSARTQSRSRRGGTAQERLELASNVELRAVGRPSAVPAAANHHGTTAYLLATDESGGDVEDTATEQTDL